MSLFLGYLFYSIDLCFLPSAKHLSTDHYDIVSLKSGRLISSTLFFLKIILPIMLLLPLHIILE
jgi:hypothetical protein